MMKRGILILVAVLLALLVGPVSAINVSNCPQLCTPSCPCSIQCLGPFGPTTCGQAGLACTGFAANSGAETDIVFLASFLDSPNTSLVVESTEIAQPSEEATEAQTEPQAEATSPASEK